jgi:hypothetical protein
MTNLLLAMSIPEETGKVATAAINAMQGNPLCLAVVVLVLGLSVMVYLRQSAREHDQAMALASVIERCMEPAKR